jgi:hypothetical protein
MSIHTLPVSTQASVHIQQIQAALAVLDSEFAQLKAAFTSDSSSIKTFSSLSNKVKAIRHSFKRSHEKCFAGLLEISKACRDWQAIADHIETGSKLPENLDLQLIVASTTAKKAFQCGAIQHNGADEIRKHAECAQKTIGEFTSKFRRIQGAGEVALSRKQAEIYLAASICKTLSYRDRQLCKSIGDKCTTLQRLRVEKQRALVNDYRNGKKS